MGSRSTLAWERCEVCGRHGPVFECKRLGLTVCPHCRVLLDCEGRRHTRERRQPGSRVRRKAKLAPDEDLIEALASRRLGASRR